MPDGHFYSPIVSRKDLEGYESQIWGEQLLDSLPGINLNVEKQLALLQEFAVYYADLHYTADPAGPGRYYFGNNSYEHTDAIILYSFIRHFQPKHIIEVGSGFSSALMLDTREKYSTHTKLTFIEPYPKLLYSLLEDRDKEHCTIRPTKVQDVSLEQFTLLQENDILFIDSSHVSKTGSDVNYEILKILPALNSGVIIHFHDIFYPFEYLKDWVEEGRNWNEGYMLRAFLSYNDAFEILFFGDYLHKHHPYAYKDMPLTYENTGGNIWLRKK